MDTAKERDMIVTLRERDLFKFKECASGIYYYNNTKHESEEATNNTHKTRYIVHPYYILNTVNNKKGYLTRQEISGADRA